MGSKKNGSSAKSAVALALVVLACGSWSLAVWDTGRMDGEYSESEAYNESLSARVESLEASNLAVKSEALALETGMDAERVARDKDAAESLIGRVLTWDSFSSYSSMRESVKDELKLDEGSRFLDVFLPEVHETLPTADGTVYNYIDLHGVNARYTGMRQHLCSTDGNFYSYMAFVEWASRDANGNEAYSDAVFLYSTDSDGNILDLDAYTLSEL